MACSVAALTVYDMVKGIEPGVVIERVELLDKTGGKADFHRHDGVKPLVDGHGRPIGDVRISVTDRCNFRCQYCMPAEGLPWLNRDALLTYEEIERLVRLLSVDGRARRAPDRRRAARAPRAVAPRREAVGDRGRPRPLADHQRLPARAPGRRPGARRPAARQRLARRAGARPLLPAHPARLARSRCSTGSPPPSATRSCGRSRSTSSRCADFTEDEVLRFAEFARQSPTRCASSSSCRSTPTAPGARDQRAAERGGAPR